MSLERELFLIIRKGPILTFYPAFRPISRTMLYWKRIHIYIYTETEIARVGKITHGKCYKNTHPSAES